MERMVCLSMLKPRRPNYRKIDKVQSGRIARNLQDLAGIAARRVKGSGSKWYAKGDTWSEMFLFENKDKATPSKQRTIHKEHLEKIRIEALQENKIPVYAVSFGDGVDYMIMRDDEWYDIVRRMVEAERRLAEIEPEYEELKYRLEGLEK
jgi:hypothetical protein